MTAFRNIIAALLCLALTGCLDTSEEIWLRSDGSGAARIHAAAPAAAAVMYGGEDGIKKLIEEFLAEAPSVTSHIIGIRTAGDRLEVDLTITFSNAIDLQRDTSGPAIKKLPLAGAEMVGKAEIDFKGLNAVFTRRVELSRAAPLAMFAPEAEFEGHRVTTIIHLPKPASKHNATSTADGGRTLIWETALSEAFRKPVVTSFTMPLPIPWIYICLVTLLVMLLFAALIYYLLRSRRAKAITP
jgi:hypothetical protein